MGEDIKTQKLGNLPKIKELIYLTGEIKNLGILV